MPESRTFHIHLVSDATGETLQAIAKAALVQFQDVAVHQHFWFMIRSGRHMERVFDEMADSHGLILYTVVNPEIRAALTEEATKRGFPAISVLDPVIDGLTGFLGARASGRAGLQHTMDARYFRRIDALQYSMTHDDGRHTQDLTRADIVLVGVSRTSKTPTCIYLANRGYRTANVPFVPGVPLPDALFDKGLGALIVGLATNPERLIEIRQQRLKILNQAADTAYVDPEAVRAEILACKRLCHNEQWPVIDVTRRSIEKTAASIMTLHQQKREKEGLPPFEDLVEGQYQ